MSTVVNIGGSQASNVPWVKELILVPKSKVISTVDPAFEVNENQYLVFPGYLVLAADAKLVKIDFAPRTCTWSERVADTMGVRGYLSVFGWEFSKNNGSLTSWLLDTRQQEFIAIWTDRNGEVYVTGTSEVGLELSYDRVISNRNMVAVNLTGIIDQPTYNVSATDLNAFMEEVEFSEEYSVEFYS